jgi:hypothetical protein
MACRRSLPSVFKSIESVIMNIREIIRYDLNLKEIDRFESLRQASEITGVNITSICRCCRGKANMSGGFLWRYDNSNQEGYIKRDPLDYKLEFLEDPYNQYNIINQKSIG